MITDIAGRYIDVGDVVAYGAASRGATWTRLYIVQSIKITIENRREHTIDPVTGEWVYSEPKPMEFFHVCVRGFKQSWYEQQTGKPVKTYVRNIYNPDLMVKIENLNNLDPNEPIHEAILEWLNNHCLRVGQRPPTQSFQHIHK